MAIIERYLTMVATYLEREKNSPTTTEVLDAIDKLTVKVSRNHEKIEEDTTVIRKRMTDFSSSPPLLLLHHLHHTLLGISSLTATKPP